MVSYNAKAVDGQLCLEASPVEGNSFFAHSPHATMLEVRHIISSVILTCTCLFIFYYED